MQARHAGLPSQGLIDLMPTQFLTGFCEIGVIEFYLVICFILFSRSNSTWYGTTSGDCTFLVDSDITWRCLLPSVAVMQNIFALENSLTKARIVVSSNLSMTYMCPLGDFM